MAKVIIQDRKECFFCKTNKGLHIHHIFYGSNHSMSEKHNMVVYLCGLDHNLSDDGVHFNPQKDLYLKKCAQKYFEENIGTHDYFMQEFGKNYL